MISARAVKLALHCFMNSAPETQLAGVANTSTFETFDRMAGKIDQLEAEAEAAGELQEEYSGDVLASKFQSLERGAGADEELAALKRKMGMLPPEEAPAVRAETPKRVEAPSVTAPPVANRNEQDELAAALEEMEAEQQTQEQQRKAGR